MDKSLGKLGCDGNIQLRAQHDGVGDSLRAGMVIEEDVGTLDGFITENGFQADGVGPQFVRLVQIVISLVTMLVPPPFIEFSPMKS